MLYSLQQLAPLSTGGDVSLFGSRGWCPRAGPWLVYLGKHDPTVACQKVATWSTSVLLVVGAIPP